MGGALELGWGWDCSKGQEGTFWGVRNVLESNYGGGPTGVYVLQNRSNCVLKYSDAFYCAYTLKHLG